MMTGEQLLEQLQKMSPEQRKLAVFTKAEDVGKWRETFYFPVTSIRKADVSLSDKPEEGLLIQ